ncbi:hypothetical protein [Exiguobacterium sp. AM39-5BH]|uniref:hypothetical protein n=1 Tax=Exiguobacterium sp. AM39-5BH TaxID=2292355 RepID=UPI000FE1A498|nr:hypothetical protein [Exiguobacterium sp. AM39-5BH]RHB49588.1 hypothetical protein DW881_07260 [Exiguobacterium sp. AM39-5BH]
MRREQHIRRLVDYARQGKMKTFILGAASAIVTGTLIPYVSRFEFIVLGIGFLGVIPLAVREWRLGTIRASFNDNATYQRLVRLPFWLTLCGLVMLYTLIGWYDSGSAGPSFFILFAALCIAMFVFQRAFDYVILKLEPDYITDRELHRELK